jgi:hypothetical protein
MILSILSRMFQLMAVLGCRDSAQTVKLLLTAMLQASSRLLVFKATTDHR